MSYSICVCCQKMVYAYEKYCPVCVEKFGLKQDTFFHKNNYLRLEDYPAEFAKDRTK